MSKPTPASPEIAGAPAGCCSLTPMQRAMVLASERAPHSGTYVLQTICTMHYKVDPALLGRAWRCVAGRHEILRTTLHLNSGRGLFQQIHETADLRWEERDWRGLSALEQEQQFAALLDQDCREGFPLGGEVPWRIILVRTGDCAFTQIWSAHHALLDGRSQFLVMEELFAAYEVFCDGNEPRLEDPVPFRRHAEWLQHRDLTGADHFWREIVDPSAGESSQVFDRLWYPDSADGEPYVRHSLRLSRESAERLEAFARQNELTLNTMLQGAWSLLLSRYSGSPDVVFGATRACRKSSVPGADKIVGPLINTVPMGVKVAGDMPLLPWLRDLRRRWLKLRPHEHTPLDRIQEWCGASPAKQLFQSLLVYDHQSLNDALQSLGGNWQRRSVNVRQRVDSPITLAASGNPQLTLELICDRRCFSDATVERMIRHLQNLLEGFPQNGGTAIARLPLLSAREQEQILHEWNETSTAYPRDLCAHEIFEATAAEHPLKEALLDGARSLSYKGLNEISNQLAHNLRERGIGPEKLVGVCLERSPDVVIAILAILKAGGAFLPLDPSLPHQRLIHMLRESGASWVVTRNALASLLENCAAELLCLDALGTEIARQPKENLPRSGTSGDAAYAIYTSGSTGEPKAILVVHRSLVNHTLFGRRFYGISTRDRRVQFASIGTDFFVAELFNYISSGATLVFQPAGLSSSIHDFLRFLAKNAITVAAFPASYWHQWVYALSEGQLSLPETLRLVITGMERIEPHLYSVWKSNIGARIRWCNVYGPSETTCTATVYEAGTSAWEERSFVPIGRPMANARVYVVDQNMNPVPVGVEGEVYIGGEGVARGYLHRPDQTAERFIPDPFTGAATGRVYRTGDLAFYLPDGNLVFTGRADRQIKIRGFRVELDEIEAALGRHPAVRQCAVTACEADSRQFLAAYVMTPGDPPSDEELRRHLSTILPDPMMPAVFVRLDSMPLTPSGKVDRKSLPTPTRGMDCGAADSRLPTTPAQRRLASIWSDILGATAVDTRASFFDLGGDSLQAARLLIRIRKEFSRELTFSDLLAAPTIERLAWNLERPNTQRAREYLVALQESGSRPPFFLAHGGDGEVMIYRDLARHMGKDQPCYAFQAFGINAVKTPLGGVEEIAARYIEEMRAVQPWGPYFVGGFCLGAFIALEMAIQLSEGGEDVRMVAVINTDAAWRDEGSACAGLRRHVLHLWHLPFRRKLSYLRGRAGYRISRIHNTVLEAYCRALAASGRTLPPRLRRFQVQETCHRAGQRYQPRPFRGKIICFHGMGEPEAKPGKFWERIARGGVEVHWVPGEDLTVLRPPHVQVLAECLRQSIAAASPNTVHLGCKPRKTAMDFTENPSHRLLF
jgi:amino acid adenylation domain-containing protein